MIGLRPVCGCEREFTAVPNIWSAMNSRSWPQGTCTWRLLKIQRRGNFPFMKFSCIWVFTLLIFAMSSQAATQQVEGDFAITNFQFHSGQTLPELRMHYLTFGKPERGRDGKVRNAVLILHGTTGSCGQFLNAAFADELYGRGQPLDITRYYLIIPDGIGHGKSSKPSDGLRAKFPNYGYQDMVEAQYRLVTEGLGVNHLRLVMGTSMGGMHTWMWGEKHPDFMDALMPLASEPTQISGRNRIWRRMIIDSIRNSPDWQNGDYQV